MKIQYKDKMLEVEEKTKISELLKKEIETSEYMIVGANYNNEYVDLDQEIKEDGKIELIDISSKEGMRIYKRTLIYIFAKALKKMYPDNKATVNYQLANATYCDIGEIEVTEELVQKLNEEMRKIIKSDLPIEKKIMSRAEAERFYEETIILYERLQKRKCSGSFI